MGVESSNTSRQSYYPKYTVKGMSAGDHPDGALNHFVDIEIGNSVISALRADGNVFSWGDNTKGQLGIGRTSTYSYAPVQAVYGESPHNVEVSSLKPYLRNIVDLAVGNDHTLALSENNTLYTWGSNAVHQLGIHTTSIPDGATEPVTTYDEYRNAPTKVNTNINYTNETIVGISANNNSSMAVMQNGYLYAWGQNTTYQAGQGSTSAYVDPIYVKRGESFYQDDVTPELGWVQYATVSPTGGAVVRYDGSVYSWGSNGSNHNVGDNSTIEVRPTPVQTGVREDRREVLGIAYVFDRNTLAPKDSYTADDLAKAKTVYNEADGNLIPQKILQKQQLKN